ncbi:MAG: hypothetical protein L3J65_09195 [Robiginitomaculum sp.]|nr:hypothetical protein [Robiginitomaculum sp.]
MGMQLGVGIPGRYGADVEFPRVGTGSSMITIGINEDEIVLTGDDAQDFLDRLRAAENRGDITITTTSVEVTVEPPQGTITVTTCIETGIFGCVIIRRTTQ